MSVLRLAVSVSVVMLLVGLVAIPLREVLERCIEAYPIITLLGLAIVGMVFLVVTNKKEVA